MPLCPVRRPSKIFRSSVTVYFYFMVWHRTTWPVSVNALQRSMVVLVCDHRMTISCSCHRHVQLPLVRAPSTPPDQHPGMLYPLRFVIWQSHWEHLGRCWNRFCSDWQMCIGHGIRVAAGAFVTFVKGRLKCLLLLLLLVHFVFWLQSLRTYFNAACLVPGVRVMVCRGSNCVTGPSVTHDDEETLVN